MTSLCSKYNILQKWINLLSSERLGELVLGEGFHGDIPGQTEDAHAMLLVQLTVVRGFIPRVVGVIWGVGGHTGGWLVVYTDRELPNCQLQSFIKVNGQF